MADIKRLEKEQTTIRLPAEMKEQLVREAKERVQCGAM